MTNQIDIYRTANLLIKQHGDIEAAIHAAQRAEELLDAGDMEGRRVWLKVLRAVKELSGTEPPRDGETVH